jgi:tellurite resistance protein
MENAAGLISRVLPANAIDDVVIDAIVLSACSDGMSKEELEALATMARELPSLAGKDEAAVTDRIRESFERIERDGLEGRLKQLGADTSMDDATRRRIFCAAAIIQYADGHVTNEENEFLLDLADVLGLDEKTVREIVADIEKNLEKSLET